MKDKSLWERWKIVAWLVFVPMPEAAGGALVCPDCMWRIDENPRKPAFFTHVHVGRSVEEQVEDFQAWVTASFQDRAYSFGVYLEELKEVVRWNYSLR